MPSATASRTVCSAVNCGSCGRNPIRIPGIGTASPSNSRSSPAMIRNSVDLPEPFNPSTPILAPGKNDREMSLRMTRFGGTIFPTRFIVYTYWAMATVRERVGYRPRLSQAHRIGVGDELCQPRQTGDGVAKSRVCPNKKNGPQGRSFRAARSSRLLPGGRRHDVRRASRRRRLGRGAQFLPALLVRVIARGDNDDFLLLGGNQIGLLRELLVDVGRLTLEHRRDGLVAERRLLPLEIELALVERRAVGVR